MVSEAEIEVLIASIREQVVASNGFDGGRDGASVTIDGTFNVRAALEAAARVRAEADAESVLRVEIQKLRRLIASTHKSAVKHDNCQQEFCPICVGGLFVCADCGEAEAEAEERICTSHFAPQPSGMVKALEWKKPKELRFRATCTHFGYEYFIDQTPNGWLLQTYLFGDEDWETLGCYHALDDAMYAAQADYERRPQNGGPER